METLKIGITGGIGAGKSLACAIFEVIGIPVYYADAEAKRLMVEDLQLVSQIKALLGDQAYNPDENLNKGYISNQIFEQPELRLKLNALVHPAVHSDLSKWFQAQTTPYALEEAALIIESGGAAHFDKIILVTAPAEIRVQRVMKRNQISRDDVIARLASQTSEQYKRPHCDFEIINDGKHSLIEQVLYIHNLLSMINKKG